MVRWRSIGDISWKEIHETRTTPELPFNGPQRAGRDIYKTAIQNYEEKLDQIYGVTPGKAYTM